MAIPPKAVNLRGQTEAKYRHRQFLKRQYFTKAVIYGFNPMHSKQKAI